MTIVDALRELQITTPRLVLTIPDSEHWRRFAAEIAGRVVPAESAHFLGSWALLASPQFEKVFVAARERTLARCTRSWWGIELAALVDEQIVGQASLYARDWTADRDVITASLVHPDWRMRGIATEMRAGLLTLAFGVLDATAAWSGASADNFASNRVSEKLGYIPLGEQPKPVGAEARKLTRLRLTAEAWQPRSGIEVTAGAQRVRDALT